MNWDDKQVFIKPKTQLPINPRGKKIITQAFVGASSCQIIFLLLECVVIFTWRAKEEGKNRSSLVERSFSSYLKGFQDHLSPNCWFFLSSSLSPLKPRRRNDDVIWASILSISVCVRWERERERERCHPV